MRAVSDLAGRRSLPLASFFSDLQLSVHSAAPCTVPALQQHVQICAPWARRGVRTWTASDDSERVKARAEVRDGTPLPSRFLGADGGKREHTKRATSATRATRKTPHADSSSPTSASSASARTSPRIASATLRSLRRRRCLRAKALRTRVVPFRLPIDVDGGILREEEEAQLEKVPPVRALSPAHSQVERLSSLPPSR